MMIRLGKAGSALSQARYGSSSAKLGQSRPSDLYCTDPSVLCLLRLVPAAQRKGLSVAVLFLYLS